MMLIPASVRIHLAVEPCDMRRGFDALAAVVADAFGEDPLSGHLFVFRSRRGDRVKILAWDRDGFVLWYKRLERGTFRFDAAARAGAAQVELSRRDLAMLLEGLHQTNIRKLPRYSCNRPRVR
jgi:transposase